MVQYDMSADCKGEVARGALLASCLFTKSCQACRVWIQHDSTTDCENPRSRRNSFLSFLKTIWLLSANKGKSRHLLECWTNISEPWGVISKCGIVVGSDFHRRSPLPRTKRSDTRLMLALKSGFVRGVGVDTRRERERKKKSSRRWQPYAVSSQARPTL